MYYNNNIENKYNFYEAKKGEKMITTQTKLTENHPLKKTQVFLSALLEELTVEEIHYGQTENGACILESMYHLSVGCFYDLKQNEYVAIIDENIAKKEEGILAEEEKERIYAYEIDEAYESLRDEW